MFDIVRDLRSVATNRNCPRLAIDPRHRETNHRIRYLFQEEVFRDQLVRQRTLTEFQLNQFHRGSSIFSRIVFETGLLDQLSRRESEREVERSGFISVAYPKKTA